MTAERPARETRAQDLARCNECGDDATPEQAIEPPSACEEDADVGICDVTLV
jgi:hypothetical protein